MIKTLKSIVNLTTKEIKVEQIHVLSEVEIFYQKDFVKILKRCLSSQKEPPAPKSFGCKPGICCQQRLNLTCFDFCTKITLFTDDIIYPQSLIKGHDGILVIVKNQLIPLHLSWLVAKIEEGILSLYSREIQVAI